MKKISLYSLVCVMLIGCGGGTATSEDSSTAGDDPVNPATYTAVPFEDAPILSEAKKTEYLKAINDARALKDINTATRNCGTYNGQSYENMPAVDPLIWNDKLYNAAAEHSQDLAEWSDGTTTPEEGETTFSHTGSATNSDWTYEQQSLSSGSNPFDRIKNNGYTYAAYGENITAGAIDATVNGVSNDRDGDGIFDAGDAVANWLASPGHCALLMSPNFTEVGMAKASNDNSYFKHFWTQVLGKPQQ